MRERKSTLIEQEAIQFAFFAGGLALSSEPLLYALQQNLY